MSSITPFMDVLMDCKRAGLDFDAAWQHAWQTAKPKLRDFGCTRTEQDSLFDQTAADTVRWLERICRDAYTDAPSIVTGGPSRMRQLRDMNLPDTGGVDARRATSYSRAA